MAIDDATRLVYAELLPDEKGRTVARFLTESLYVEVFACHACPGIGKRSNDVGIDAGGRSRRQAAAGDEPIGRLDRLQDRVEHGVELVGAQLGAWLIDLGRRPVGLDDGDVRPDRPADPDRYDLDPSVPLSAMRNRKAYL